MKLNYQNNASGIPSSAGWRRRAREGAELLGRFLSPDPFVQSPGYSQSYNRYSYCFNNPLKYSDPGGYKALLLPEERLCHSYSSASPGVYRIGWNTCPYRYDWNTGKYYNSQGKEVSWDEVNENYVQPNSISFNSYISSLISSKRKHSGSQGNQQIQVDANNLLADIREALLGHGNMMFNGTLDDALGLGDDPNQDNRVNLITSLDVITEVFEKIHEAYLEGNLINLYDIIVPNGYGNSSPLGPFYKKTFNMGGFEYKVFVIGYNERQKNSFYDIEQMGFGYLDICGNYARDKRINGGYYIGFYLINSDCCNLITIGAQNPDAYYFLKSYFHSFDK